MLPRSSPVMTSCPCCATKLLRVPDVEAFAVEAAEVSNEEVLAAQQWSRCRPWRESWRPSFWRRRRRPDCAEHVRRLQWDL